MHVGWDILGSRISHALIEGQRNNQLTDSLQNTTTSNMALQPLWGPAVRSASLLGFFFFGFWFFALFFCCWYLLNNILASNNGINYHGDLVTSLDLEK